jgi:ATP-dependent Zn protease
MHSEHKNTLNELLNQMDGFYQDDSLIIIGATNIPGSLDPALLRPGRFDRIVNIPLPNTESRRDIFEHYFSYVVYDHASLKFDELADKTQGLSGADIKNIVNESAIQAVRENKHKVAHNHVLHILESYKR